MMDVWTSLAISAATTLGVALAVLFGVWLFVRIAGKRLSWLAEGYRAIRPRLRFFVVTLALNISFQVVEVSPEQWWDITRQMFVIPCHPVARFLGAGHRELCFQPVCRQV
jgi:hypothetical protein